MAADKNMRILIVDDFKTMLMITDNLLRQMGFKNIDQARDGTEALEKMAKTQYGLILSDWNMEPMDGLSLLRKIRATPATKNVPVILITAESKPENIIVAKQAGVNNYIVKPFNGVTLKEKISAVIGAI